jgi:GDPmannose 4,6-dehydratase
VQKDLILGNLEARRDWGYAKEYVEAMWMMLQQSKPVDYVVGTGETHSVREFVDAAFSSVDLNWKDYVKNDEKFMRPAEVDQLVANPEKIEKNLGWKYKTDYKELAKIMVESDLKLIKNSFGK